jgi:hypothetical protein
MAAFIGAEVDVGDERLTIVLKELRERHSDLPHLVGGDLDADWFTAATGLLAAYADGVRGIGPKAEPYRSRLPAV